MRRRVEIIVLLAVAVVAVLGVHFYIRLFTPPSDKTEIRVIDIPKGSSFRVIAAAAEREGVVRDSDDLLLAARIMGAQSKVQAGEYEFTTSMTVFEVLDTLTSGRVRKHLVTIPEGYNMREVARLLSKEGLADESAFLEKARDSALVASLGLEGHTFEGYLFPDTYQFTKGLAPEEIVRTMAERFKAVYFSDFDAIARRRGMTMRKAVTLASIVEKETGAPSERELISAVFHNRLRKGIRLQSDPTIIYALEEFDGNLTRKHLKTRTPYNTYLYYGLPPGPIANPGRDAIRAALNPAEEDYLYFVSRNDGTHYFSKTLREHNNAVNTYQRRARKPSGA